jgi:Fe-S cluster biogenesis protein NfuA
MANTILIHPTPNPNALKFVLDTVVKSKDSAVYKQGVSANNNAMAAAILALPNVTEVYFASRFITVTQDGGADWPGLEESVKNVIQTHIATHNPDFAIEETAKPAVPLAGGMARINEILDGTIRPALQRDGGDLEIVSLEGNVLTISYQGACGSCPHSTMGTLYAIQNILRDQYDPDMTVEMA